MGPILRDIRLIEERYLAASKAEIEHHQLEWPTVQRALKLLRKAQRDTEVTGATAELEGLISSLWGWHSQLTNAPVAPALIGTSELASRLRAHAESGLDSGYAASLMEMSGLLENLARESHPGAVVLEDVISRYGADPGGSPAIYVAAHRDAVDDLRRWLSEEELDAEVMTVAALKTAEVRQALVLLGPPSSFYVSQWRPLAIASRVGGWLLAAPPARAVHVISWPGHPPLDIAAAPLLPTSEHLQIKRTMRGRPDNFATRPEEPIWLPPLPVAPEIKLATWDIDRDPVPATGLLLAGGAVAFYHDELGPRPQLVTPDAGAISVTTIEVRKIKTGQTLLFRPDRSATYNELHRRAEEYLVAKHGDGAPAKALAAKMEIKEALRKSKWSRPQLVSELSLKLNDESYARHIISRLDDDYYIAPEKPGAYPALRRVLGLPPDEQQYQWLRALRSALRRAGREINQELVGTLSSTGDWQDSLDTHGLATVVAGEEFGRLELRVVTAIDPTTKRVGRSHLGRLLHDPRARNDKVT